MLSSNSFVTNDSVVEATGLTKSEALGDKEVLEVVDFSSTTERVLLTKGTLGNEQLVGETSETPSGLTIGEDTSLE